MSSYEPEYDDSEYDESEYGENPAGGIGRKLYVLFSIAAVVAVLSGMVYGGYRVYLQGKSARNSETFALNYLNIGQNLAVAGEFEAAEEVFAGLVQENPSRRDFNQQEATAWLGCCQNALGNYEEAIETFELLRREFAPTQNDRFFLACAYASSGKEQEAAAAFWEYLLLGGVYPRPDNTFKVSHQLKELEESGKIQELLNKPQLAFKSLFSAKSVSESASPFEIGRLFTQIDSDLPKVTIEFHSVSQMHKSWTLVCFQDPQSENWQGRLVSSSADVGEFEGSMLGGRLMMTGKLIPTNGEAEFPAKLEIQPLLQSPGDHIVRLLRSYDGSENWAEATSEIELVLSPR